MAKLITLEGNNSPAGSPKKYWAFAALLFVAYLINKKR